MKTKLFLSLTIFIAGLVFSCGKKNDTIPALFKEPYGSMSDFFKKNEAPTQVFTLNAATGAVIIGAQGTKIIFPAYAFKHSNGSIVTGAVSILLREVYKKSDMLLTKLSTTSNGAPLISGTVVEVRIYQSIKTPPAAAVR